MSDVDWDGLVQTLLAEVDRHAHTGADDVAGDLLYWNIRSVLRNSNVRMRYSSNEHEAAFGEAMFRALM